MYDPTAQEENGEEILDQLAEALLKLKEKERDLIVLHYYKGYTLKRGAEMMEIGNFCIRRIFPFLYGGSGASTHALI